MTRTVPLVLSLALTLGACAETTSPAVTADAQLALTDGQAILASLQASGKLPAEVETDATLVIDGLRAVLTAYGATGATGTAEQQALSGAEAAVRQIMADSTDARVEQAGQLALAAITAVGADATAAAPTQAEAALGAVLLDYLATSAPVSQLTLARR